VSLLTHQIADATMTVTLKMASFTLRIGFGPMRTIGYNAWIEDADGNEIDEKALKMAIRSRHEDAPFS
jgi:hypothetical protein